ncbi:MAG: helix-turn-helix transcriptional regulator [Verrucomicrobiota bacterium]
MIGSLAWRQIGGALRLSPRELEVVRGVFDNLTESALAANLRVSPHTIHSHMNRVFLKLQATTRAQLVLRVMEQLLFLTRAEGSLLPPICPKQENGRCPFLRRKPRSGFRGVPL